MPQGFVVWLTGLPSSGKTTLAAAVADTLSEQGLSVRIVDGDEVRRSLSADLGFSAKDREEQARRIIRLGKEAVHQGFIVIVAAIAPYRKSRRLARLAFDCFVEVYVKCPVEECIRRDIKGLYAKALRGEITDFTGVSGPYEEPEYPEVTVETDVLSVEECRRRIVRAIKERGSMATFNSGFEESEELRFGEVG